MPKHSDGEEGEWPMDERDAVVRLLAAIAVAFASESPPPRAALVAAGTWETRDLLRALADVNDTPGRTFIEHHVDSLAAFTPAGLRHVLPHYLTYSLENPQSEASQRIMVHVSPTDTDSDYWRERLAAFTSAQKGAICQYLRFMRATLASEHDDEDFVRALHVWGCR